MTLELKNLSVRYGQIEAVKKISLTLEPGKIVAIVGPNGAGKSSLIRAVMGLQRHAGSVVLDGQVLDRMPVHKRARTGLSIVPDGRGVFPDMKVSEQLRLATATTGQDALDELRAAFPLVTTKADSLGSQLSGGQQQTISIARALGTRPKYVLMDEPSMGLSPIAVREVIAAIESLGETGAGLLLAEQNVRLALKASDYCHVMVRGSIVLSGPSSELLSDPAVSALYMGG